MGGNAPNAVLKADEKWPFDSWMLIRKGSKHLSIYPKIKFDAIALIIADKGGGLLFWDGKALRWQREERILLPVHPDWSVPWSSSRARTAPR